MRIAHLADIHIRGNERIEEYRDVFSRLYKSLQAQNIDLIIVAGDIFHTKTDNITPEAIELMVDFFRNLGGIATTHMILGNHDGNLKNEQRQDTISPIIQAIRNPNIKLHKNSEVEIINGFDFYFYSLFDKEGWSKLRVQNSSRVNICVFHGSVLGCIADNGFELSDHAEVDQLFFKDFSYSMLGDIHKRQALDKAKRINYCGSLIQQNFGEETDKGYLIWDIKDNNSFTTQFVKLSNYTPFLTVDWVQDLDTTTALIFQQFKNNTCQSGWKLKIKSNVQLSENDKQSIKTYALTKLDAKLVTFDEKVVYSVGEIELSDQSISKEELKTNKEKIKDLYVNFINSNKGSQKEVDVERGKQKIDVYMTKLDSEISSQIRDAIIKIESFEFDNIFSYGKGNKVNFTKLNGLVGVLGKNKIGKSSLIGSIALTLYNVTDRAPVKSAFVVNSKEKEAAMRMQINLSGQRYLIERKIEKQIPKKTKRSLEDEDKALTSLKLYKLDKQGSQYELNNQNATTRTDTEKVLRGIIGNPEDFLFTSLSSQGQINSFINSGATARKELLNRFLDLDIFKSLYSLVHEEVSVLKKGSLKDFDKVKIKDSITTLEESIISLKQLIEQKQSVLDEVEHFINQLPDTREYDQIQQTLKIVVSSLDRKLNEKQSKISEISSMEALLAAKLTEKSGLTTRIEAKSGNIKHIISQCQEEDEEIEKLREVKAKYEALKSDIERSKKLVKKLDTVPCGDSFPTCVYINDAHQAKQAITALQAEMIGLSFDNESFETRKELIREIKTLLKSEEVELTKLQNDFSRAEKSISDVNLQIELKKVQIQNLEESILQLQNQKQDLAKKLEMQESMTGINEIKTENLNLKREIAREINNYSVELGKSESNKLHLENELVSKEELQKEMEVLESILNAFSKNGIPALLLNTQLPIINKIVNDYLSGVVDFKLNFHTEVGVNTLEIYIQDENPRRVIELASGMEKMISSLAIRAALMQLTPLPKLDSIIIDEGFEALDSVNMNNVLKMLDKLKSNFRAVIIITHIPALKEYMDKILEIKVDSETKQSKIVYN